MLFEILLIICNTTLFTINVVPNTFSWEMVDTDLLLQYCIIYKKWLIIHAVNVTLWLVAFSTILKDLCSLAYTCFHLTYYKFHHINKQCNDVYHMQYWMVSVIPTVYSLILPK